MHEAVLVLDGQISGKIFVRLGLVVVNAMDPLPDQRHGDRGPGGRVAHRSGASNSSSGKQ